MLDIDSSNAKCLALADAEVVELVAKPGSKITRRPVKELNLPSDMTLGGVIQDGVGTIVSGNTVIKENDHAMDDIRYFCATVLRREIRRKN